MLSDGAGGSANGDTGNCAIKKKASAKQLKRREKEKRRRPTCRDARCRRQQLLRRSGRPTVNDCVLGLQMAKINSRLMRHCRHNITLDSTTGLYRLVYTDVPPTARAATTSSRRDSRERDVAWRVIRRVLKTLERHWPHVHPETRTLVRLMGRRSGSRKEDFTVGLLRNVVCAAASKYAYAIRLANIANRLKRHPERRLPQRVCRLLPRSLISDASVISAFHGRSPSRISPRELIFRYSEGGFERVIRVLSELHPQNAPVRVSVVGNAAGVEPWAIVDEDDPQLQNQCDLRPLHGPESAADFVKRCADEFVAADAVSGTVAGGHVRAESVTVCVTPRELESLGVVGNGGDATMASPEYLRGVVAGDITLLNSDRIATTLEYVVPGHENKAVYARTTVFEDPSVTARLIPSAFSGFQRLEELSFPKLVSHETCYTVCCEQFTIDDDDDDFSLLGGGDGDGARRDKTSHDNEDEEEGEERVMCDMLAWFYALCDWIGTPQCSLKRLYLHDFLERLNACPAVRPRLQKHATDDDSSACAVRRLIAAMSRNRSVVVLGGLRLSSPMDYDRFAGSLLKNNSTLQHIVDVTFADLDPDCTRLERAVYELRWHNWTLRTLARKSPYDGVEKDSVSFKGARVFARMRSYVERNNAIGVRVSELKSRVIENSCDDETPSVLGTADDDEEEEEDMRIVALVGVKRFADVLTQGAAKRLQNAINDRYFALTGVSREAPPLPLTIECWNKVFSMLRASDVV